MSHNHVYSVRLDALLLAAREDKASLNKQDSETSPALRDQTPAKVPVSKPNVDDSIKGYELYRVSECLLKEAPVAIRRQYREKPTSNTLVTKWTTLCEHRS